MPCETAPRYLYEPENITAITINGIARAAFSCAITPVAGLVQIHWYYESMSHGVNQTEYEMDSEMISNDSGGVTIIDLACSGVSILVLDSASNAHEGLYSCVAIFTDGTMLNSSQAALNVSKCKLTKSYIFMSHILQVC